MTSVARIANSFLSWTILVVMMRSFTLAAIEPVSDLQVSSLIGRWFVMYTTSSKSMTFPSSASCITEDLTISATTDTVPNTVSIDIKTAWINNDGSQQSMQSSIFNLAFNDSPGTFLLNQQGVISAFLVVSVGELQSNSRMLSKLKTTLYEAQGSDKRIITDPLSPLPYPHHIRVDDPNCNDPSTIPVYPGPCAGYPPHRPLYPMPSASPTQYAGKRNNLDFVDDTERVSSEAVYDPVRHTARPDRPTVQPFPPDTTIAEEQPLSLQEKEDTTSIIDTARRLAEQYQWVVISDGTSNTLMILARSVSEFKQQYQSEVLQYAAENGFSVGNGGLKEVDQFDECMYTESLFDRV